MRLEILGCPNGATNARFWSFAIANDCIFTQNHIIRDLKEVRLLGLN
jgi:hypothetical protein